MSFGPHARDLASVDGTDDSMGPAPTADGLAGTKLPCWTLAGCGAGVGIDV
jgi:hypothetical protein